MNWVLALLAFAGLMTILSTIVYIIVEALHKGLSLRKAGLSEMLRSIHDTVVCRLENDEYSFIPTEKPREHTEEAIAFAKQVQQSPTFAGKQKWYSPSNWGINLNQRKFERLSRRQLVEQLAQTEFGKKLAAENRSRIEFSLERLAYEFDRFGEAQSAYFKKRAKVLSGVVAFAFVVIANVNVIDIYFYLAKNDQALNSTLSALSADNPEEFARLKNSIESSAQAFAAQLETEGVTSDAALATARDLQFYLSELQGGLNLPIGRDYFPYCADPLVDSGRCATEATEVDGKIQYAPAPTSFSVFGLADVPAPPAVARMANHWQTGLYWVFCMIASAGLLALGAPFWFDLFNKAASLVGNAAAGRVMQVATEEQRIAEEAKAKKKLERSDNPSVEEMADAFLIAAGVPQSKIPPREIVGMKISASSAEFIGAETTPSNATNPTVMPAPVIAPGTEGTDANGRVIPQPVYQPQNPSVATHVSETTATTEAKSEAQLTKPIRGIRGNWKGS